MYDLSEIKRHEIKEAKIYEDRIEGMFEINDPNFGNLWTNILLSDFLKAGFKMGDVIPTKVFYKDEVVFDEAIPYFDSFGKAKDGSVMIYNNEINKMGFGPAGLGGNTTALGVNIETSPTHIAGMPVAVNICCHAARHASVEI